MNRTRRPGRRDTAVSWRDTAALWVDRGLETCWLVAVIVVPLIVLSHQSFITPTELPKMSAMRILAGCAAVLLAARWLLEWPAQGRRLDRAGAWIAIAAVCGLAAAVLSTVLSVHPPTSLWGRSPTEDGGSLYNMASLIILFLAVSLRLRSAAQMWHLLGAVCAAGTAAAAVGAAQHWGFAPFGIGGTGGHRITGPSGNPIFLGALLVMTLPVALGAGLAYAARRSTSAAWWAVMIAVTLAHFLGLVLTLSRGPWGGAIVSLGVVLALAWTVLGRKAALRLTAIVGAAGAGTLLILSLPDLPGRPATGAYGLDRVQARVATMPGALSTGLTGRQTRWLASARLVAWRPEMAGGFNPGYALRTLFGYGPDTYRHVLPLESPAELAGYYTNAAHNDLINTAVELGAAGLLAHVALWLAMGWMLFRRLRARRPSAERRGAGGPAAVEMAILIGIAGALAGRFGEQMFGIPQAGDRMVFWILAGGLAVVPVALAAGGEGEEAPAASRRAGGVLSRWPALAPGRARAAAAGCVAAVTIAVCLLTWVRTVDYLRADTLASSTRFTFSDQPHRAVADIDRAIMLAADVPDYHSRRARMLRGIAEATQDPEAALAFRLEAYRSDQRALAARPLARESYFTAASSAWELAATGLPDLALDSLAYYERLALIAPQHPAVAERLPLLRSAITLAE